MHAQYEADLAEIRRQHALELERLRAEQEARELQHATDVQILQNSHRQELLQHERQAELCIDTLKAEHEKAVQVCLTTVLFSLCSLQAIEADLRECRASIDTLRSTLSRSADEKVAALSSEVDSLNSVLGRMISLISFQHILCHFSNEERRGQGLAATVQCSHRTRR